jgi:hypothetical protein
MPAIQVPWKEHNDWNQGGKTLNDEPRPDIEVKGLASKFGVHPMTAIISAADREIRPVIEYLGSTPVPAARGTTPPRASSS